MHKYSWLCTTRINHSGLMGDTEYNLRVRATVRIK
jgi:hypothetical protein